MYSKGVSIQLFIVFFSILSATVFAEREMFKPVLALDKVKKRNLDVEEIAGTGNYRIYYREQDGKVHFVRFEPATKVDVIVKLCFNQDVQLSIHFKQKANRRGGVSSLALPLLIVKFH